MNKGELIDAVAEKANVTKKQADAVLTAAIETIVEAVSSGDKVTLVGFGSFESRERKAREGRNPKTPFVNEVRKKLKMSQSNCFLGSYFIRNSEGASKSGRLAGKIHGGTFFPL